MDWALIVVLQVIVQPALSVLFTVEVEQTTYTSEFEGSVVMGCKFNPKLSQPPLNLNVTWYRNTKSLEEVIQIDNGVEKAVSPKYQGRVKLLTDELNKGWAKLQISQLRINDSGNYQCLIRTEAGADFKTMSLSVVAPYKSVAKHIEKSAKGDQLLITCQSEGYPISPVVWHDELMERHPPKTTTVLTPNQLYNITSQIQVSSSEKNNYTCNFTNDGSSATFHIPDEIPISHVKNDAVIILLIIAIMMVLIAVGVLIYRQKKGFRTCSTRNLLRNGQDRCVTPAAACLQINEENETTTFKEAHVEENPGSYLKSYYTKTSLSTEVRHHCDIFGVEELAHRLLNDEGQSVNLPTLLPEASEILFLEEPP